MKNRNEKRSGKLKWLLIILIILIVLAGAGSALFIFAVDDGLEGFRATLEELPVISWFLPDAELKLAEQRIHQLEKRLEESQKIIEEQEKLLELVEESISDRDGKIEELTKENQELAAQLEEERLDREQRQAHLTKMAQLYTSMSASKAAAILEKMTLSEAAQIMSYMDQNAQAKILARMEPGFASELTVVMKEMELSTDPDLAALQERLVMLMDSSQETGGPLPLQQLVATFEQMSPAQAAQILMEMENDRTQFNLARNILANMGENARARVLEQMSVQSARAYVEAMSR